MSEPNQVTNVPFPLEVTSKIFSILPFSEKLSARLVCNYWRTIMDTFGKYKFRLTMKDNSLVDSFLNSFSDLEFVELGGVTKAMSSTYSRNKFPRIRKAFLGNKNSGPVVLSFLKYGLMSTEELMIAPLAFQNIHKSQISSVLRESKWENLLKLELNIITDENDKGKSSRKQVTGMSCLMEFANIPHLKEFAIHLDHNSNLGDDGSLIQRFCSNLYGFISRHSETLKSLSWVVITEMQDGFPVPPIPKEIMETMHSKLKLETYTVLTQPDPKLLALTLSSVCGSDSLTSFTLNIHNHYLMPMAKLAPQDSEAIGQVLQRNRMTLTDINIGVIVLDMSMLKSCHKLKTLFIEVGNLEDGMINMSAEDVNFPELKSFQVFGCNLNNFAESSNFDFWIVERMRMVEKIKFTTFPAFVTVQMLQNLVNGLSQLEEITIEMDFFSLGFKGHELNTYCDDTEGLTFKYLATSHPNVFRSYVIEINR